MPSSRRNGSDGQHAAHAVCGGRVGVGRASGQADSIVLDIRIDNLHPLPTCPRPTAARVTTSIPGRIARLPADVRLA